MGTLINDAQTEAVSLKQKQDKMKDINQSIKFYLTDSITKFCIIYLELLLL